MEDLYHEGQVGRRGVGAREVPVPSQGEAAVHCRRALGWRFCSVFVSFGAGRMWPGYCGRHFLASRGDLASSEKTNNELLNFA
jgi:hypothetical protein